MSGELTKEAAVEAVRAAAWWTEVETCGHRGCEEHLGQGTQRIHTYLGMFGADWDLGEALALIEQADEVGWVPHLFRHDLAVKSGGKVYRFDVRQADPEVPA